MITDEMVKAACEATILGENEYGHAVYLEPREARTAIAAPPAPAVSVKAEQQLNVIIDAWETLPGGRHVAVKAVEAWLADDMAPAINAARAFLGRDKPDGSVNSIHPDDLAVDRFASAMKAKLAKKRSEGRGGWDNDDKSIGVLLSNLLREHVEKGDPLDVGNLAMMLHQRGERILSTLNTSSEPVAPAVPEGWKLVPLEPKPEMLGAWYRYKNGHHWPDEPVPPDTSDYGAYRAMLAAAPEAPNE